MTARPLSDLCIVGGGMSGLALAAFVKENLSIHLLEQSPTLGGLLQNSSDNNIVRDHAANGWLNNEPSVEKLLKIIALEKAQLSANEHRNTRYLVHQNRLHALNPKILFSSLISWKGLWGICRDLWTKAGVLEDESMAAFISRRFHRDLVDNFVAPMTAGIYACEPEELSVPAAFPNLWNLEKEHGSLIKGMRQSKTPRGQLTTIKGGMGQFVEGLQKYLDGTVHCHQTVESISWNPEQHWSIQSRNEHQAPETWHCKNLALTCPAPIQSKLLQPLFPKIAEILAQIEYAPVAVVIQEFDVNDFTNIPRGFGGLMTRSQREDGVLGILFTSEIFPSHSQPHTILTRTILGGSIQPDIVQKSNQELMHLALKRHQQIFKSPNLQSQKSLVIKHPMGIPKYPVGHIKIQEQITQFHQEHPNIRLSGNHLFGVAIKDCIRNAHHIAQHFIQHSTINI